jgi:hypothetical protein
MPGVFNSAGPARPSRSHTTHPIPVSRRSPAVHMKNSAREGVPTCRPLFAPAAQKVVALRREIH